MFQSPATEISQLNGTIKNVPYHQLDSIIPFDHQPVTTIEASLVVGVSARIDSLVPVLRVAQTLVLRGEGITSEMQFQGSFMVIEWEFHMI